MLDRTMTERPERRRIRPDDDPAIAKSLAHSDDRIIRRKRIALKNASARMLAKLERECRLAQIDHKLKMLNETREATQDADLHHMLDQKLAELGEAREKIE
jgi:hypothetical protein